VVDSNYFKLKTFKFQAFQTFSNYPVRFSQANLSICCDKLFSTAKMEVHTKKSKDGCVVSCFSGASRVNNVCFFMSIKVCDKDMLMKLGHMLMKHFA